MDGKKKNGIVPDDGTYIGNKKGNALRAKKTKEDFDNAWKSQKELLKNSIVKLFKETNSLSVRWNTLINWDDSILTTPRRIRRGLSLLGRGKFPLTANAVKQAVSIAEEIDLKIKAGSFTWQDYPQWLPKEYRPKNLKNDKTKTIAWWIEEYERDYWLSKNKERYQDQRNWDNSLFYLKKIKNWNEHPNKEIFDEACRSYPKSKKRNECCSRIKHFARFCGLMNYDPKEFRLRKEQIEVRAKPKRDLTEEEVEDWYNQFPNWLGNESTPSHWQLWQWIYGMQATYGFRNHEVLNIYNLDREYVGDDGKTYYPFTDSISNPRGVIYTRGKGIKRVAFLPQPLRWIEQFKLRNIPQRYYQFLGEINKLPEYKKEKKKATKLSTYGKFLREHGFTFTAYNLRHAWNVKSHGLGIPVSLIAKNLGHTILQNTTTYLSSQSVKSCLDALDDWEKRQGNKESNNLSVDEQIRLLRQENEQLKAIIQQLLESLKTD